MLEAVVTLHSVGRFMNWQILKRLCKRLGEVDS